MVKSYLIGSIIGAAAIGASLWGAYSQGQSDIQSKWDAEKVSQATQQKTLQDKYDALQKMYALLQESSDKALKVKEKEYEKALADAATHFADGVRKSDNRAEWYRKQAQAGTTEQNRLAEHAARLDQSLVEGKAVAAELAATVRLRDTQIIELAKLLKGAYAVIEDTDK